MQAFKTAYILLAFIIFGLPSNMSAQTDVNGGFTHNGLARDYFIHLPPDTSMDNIPLVFNLHFFNSAGFQQQLYSGFDAVADTANIIVVYPDGYDGVWDTIFQNSPVDDIGFLSALIDTLLLEYNIDTSRIYAMGMSMGGFMSYRLACGLGERIAAIASVGGPLTSEILDQCDIAPLTPLLHIHGTADSTIPFGGDGLYLPIDSTINYFVQRNSCPATPVMTMLPDIDTTDSSTVTRSYYGPCYDSIEVVLYTVENGGHTWPGAFPFQPLGNTNQDFNASAEIWQFFSKYRLNTNAVVINIEEVIIGESRVVAYPNPSNGLFDVSIMLDEVVNPMEVSVYNSLGQLVYNNQLKEPASPDIKVRIDLTSQPKGIYLISIANANSVSLGSQRIIIH